MFHRKLHRNILRDSPVGIDKRRLKRELRKVAKHIPRGISKAKHLLGAFVLTDAPQGHKFWAKHVDFKGRA